MSDHQSLWALVRHYLAPIAPYLHMPGVTEILVDRYDRMYVERFGVFESVESQFQDEHALQTPIFQLGKALDQPVDATLHPTLDARLPGLFDKTCARINAVLPPVAVQGSYLCIRVFPETPLSAAALLGSGALTSEMLGYLTLVVETQANLLVSGQTVSGKTTLY